MVGSVRARWAVGDSRGTRGVQRSFDVREHWLAPLPEEKDHFFESIRTQLESSYQITSIALSDVLTLCRENRLPPASEQSAIVATLFDSVAQQVQAVLRALGEYGRQRGTVAAVIPLRPGFFRTAAAQRTARNSHLVSSVLFSGRARFSRKLRGLTQIVAALQSEARYIARTTPQEIAGSWNRLEELHYDLNTCLLEATVVLKSFLWVLPSRELPTFQARLLARMPRPTQFFLDDQPVSGNNN